MQIQINTDQNIGGHEALAAHINSAVESALGRFGEHTTRVEVHVIDESGDKSGPDAMRCMMETRLEGRQPIAVTHQAATVDQAVGGAVDKLTRKLESTVGRLRDRKSRTTHPSPREPKPPEE